MTRPPYEKAAEESAKAAQDLAALGDKVLDKTSVLGNFLHTVIGPGIEHLGGAFNDWARTYRYERALKLADRVEQIHRERHLKGKTVPIAPRLAIPLLDQATLENDETLGEMWAGLIANSTDPNRHVEARRSLVHLLSELEPIDALVLREIQRHLSNHPERRWGDAQDRDEEQRQRAQWPTPNTIAENLNLSSEAVAMSLENIERLGLAYDFTDLPDENGRMRSSTPVPLTHPLATIELTNTGRALLSACKP
jgi:hypothetical protein